jgi:hypothetical protein
MAPHQATAEIPRCPSGFAAHLNNATPVASLVVYGEAPDVRLHQQGVENDSEYVAWPEL